MSVKMTNAEIIRFFFENIIKSPKSLVQVCSEDCKLYWRSEVFADGLLNIQNFLDSHGRIFPDLTFTIIDFLNEGEKCAVRLLHSGTHASEWEGAKSTGRKFSVEEYMFFKIIEQKITDIWTIIDSEHKKKQIGFEVVAPN